LSLLKRLLTQFILACGQAYIVSFGGTYAGTILTSMVSLHVSDGVTTHPILPGRTPD
jgi:hypothetical protein